MEHIGPVEQIMYVTEPQRKHSGLGIASFIISIVVGIAVFVMIVVAAVAESASPDGVDEESPVAIILGLGLLMLLLLDFLALGLGIGGICQKGRKKVFSVLGTIFSCTTILGTIALLVIGLMTE
jgi:hypothetical protein